ncbi:MAG: ABC transporter substrate-binding protein [Streptosporangiaceae bacterium]
MSALKSVQVSAATLLVLAAVSACGSSGGSSNSASSLSSRSGAARITLGFAVPIDSTIQAFPEVKSAMEATTDAINAAGGINGHKVQDMFCDTQFTANGEISCMRELTVAKVSAIIDPNLINDQSGAGIKFAVANGIPVVGTQGLSPFDFTTPGVFALGSGNPGYAYGAVAALVKSGAKKIALFGSNESGADYILGLCADALKSAGMKPAAFVQVDPSADPTFASGAAKVESAGVDGVVIMSSPTYIPKEVLSLRQTGYSGSIATVAAVVTPPIIQALGAHANGVMVSSQLALVSDTSNPAVAAFEAVMKKYQPQALLDEDSEQMYAAIKLFATVMAHATSFAPSAVLKAFKSLSSPVNLGLIGPYQVVPQRTYLKFAPQIYNPTVAIGRVQNGVIVADPHQLINPFTILTSSHS